MASLGDYFNDSFKNNYAERNITVGTVIKCFVKNTNPPKEKRFVVIGIDSLGNLIGSVFINSSINWNIIKTIELAELQFYLTKENNEFLDWDSYLDCSELIEISYDIVHESIIKNPECVLGNVKSEDLLTIFDFIKKSPKISPKKLKKYNLN